jgi:signal transduction histidine kinase
MDDCVRRLRALIDNLLDVSGLETGSMRFLHRDYDFLDTTRRAIARVADRMAERRVTLVEELPRGPLPGWGDSERLSRAMIQLLDNAAKFTPAGGYVGVRVRHRPEGEYELCVADTGRGLAPDRAGRLFEPFYQMDGSPTRQHGGVGVGLAIARRIARGLGGDVRYESPSQEVMEGVPLPGTAFFLTVTPRAPEVIVMQKEN